MLFNYTIRSLFANVKKVRKTENRRYMQPISIGSQSKDLNKLNCSDLKGRLSFFYDKSKFDGSVRTRDSFLKAVKKMYWIMNLFSFVGNHYKSRTTEQFFGKRPTLKKFSENFTRSRKTASRDGRLENDMVCRYHIFVTI